MDVEHTFIDFSYALGCCLGLHAVSDKKSEAGILHVPLFPDILLFRAHETWGTWTLKGQYYVISEVSQRKPESKGKVIGLCQCE